ncbi:MAG: ferredoxin-thioredoxin reductase catalytic domain-containing protein [Methanoregula sp.]|jgi:ferredoxin-thioredoxin reductase catalytic subunit/rubredoxin
MSFIEVSEPDIDRLYRTLKADCDEHGYFLNPDTDFVRSLIRGLIKNERRYGYQACPCRLASGKKAEDLDIICPCRYRDDDVEEFNACYCALYVNAAISTGNEKAGPVPERRPPRSERGITKAIHTVSATTSPVFPLPVWRCTVCGYLCARLEPPGICPICKVTKDRFERFI